MDSERPEVQLPPSIHKQCESHIEGTEFESVEEYVTFVLEVLFEQADRDVSTDRQKDDKVVEDRLESLGYM